MGLAQIKNLGKGDDVMQTLFLKNFNGMTKEQLASAWTKCGEPEVTSRTFGELIGRNHTDIKELKLLTEILDEFNAGHKQLGFPAIVLLRLECGRGVTPATKLPETVLSYLLNTPYDVVRSDYAAMVTQVRETFTQRLSETV